MCRALALGSSEYSIAGSSGPPILLIHGFGASVYHWRYNIPELAKNHRVYALDMLGFGWSEKPVMEYQGCHIWSEQIRDFIKEVSVRPLFIRTTSPLKDHTLAFVAHDSPLRGIYPQHCSCVLHFLYICCT